MLTRGNAYAGTDSRIRLNIVSQSTEILNEQIPDTRQNDQEKNQANLYFFDVTGRNITTQLLNDATYQLVILDDDMWKPEHVMVWAESEGNLASVNGRAVFPLALEVDIDVVLSENPSKGVNNLVLRPVEKGNSDTQIERIFMFSRTQSVNPRLSHVVVSSDSPLEIQVVSDNTLVMLTEISDTRQYDLEANEANFYSAPSIIPFTKSGLDNGSMILRSKGGRWHPMHFFVFGLDTKSGRPNFIVPLSSVPDWSYGAFEMLSTNGMGEVELPILEDGLELDDVVTSTMNN